MYVISGYHIDKKNPYKQKQLPNSSAGEQIFDGNWRWMSKNTSVYYRKVI